jgi:pimeloyl-ACP methyl ester carboxylesterase
MPRTERGLHYEVTDLRAPWLRGRPSGRPVVFHHGVGASLDIFAEWLPIVAARHPVARFDMRGFGQSVVPPESHAWTMVELIADLLEVAETAFGTEPLHVMGESIGGTIALAASLEHPSRFASVAMSNAAIKGGQIGYAPGWRAEIARVGIEGWSERLMGMRFVPGVVAPEALGWFAALQARSPPHVVVGLGELLIGTDLTVRLSTFKLPLLLMMPDRSPFVSLAQADALAELVPQTEIAVFPGARHGLPFSHAKEAAGTLLAFLDRVESGRPFPPRAPQRDA